MLLSKNLLNHLFPIFKGIDELEFKHMLNSIGIDVESVFHFEKTDNLIVGQIQSVTKHPKSDHLYICEVLFENKIHTIVCGADNVKKNLKVIVAKVGTKMLSGITIGARNLLGVKSNGMICAYNELTKRVDYLSDKMVEEIIELDDDAILDDKDPLKYIGFDDTIYDLSLPANRNELNGIIPIAYDLISIYYPNQKLDFNLKNIKETKKIDFKIDIDKSICNFFSVIDASLKETKQSNWLIKSWLLNSGLTPNNFIVDISNLATIITSSPNHSYDKDKLFNNSLSIKLSENDFEFKALNNNKYNIKKDNIICIYNNDQVVCLASIMGSNASAINSQSKHIIFEIGNFNHLLIRNNANKLNLLSNAAILGSKKINLWISIKALDFLIGFLKENGFNINGINYVSNSVKLTKIKFDYVTINQLLGTSYSKTQIFNELKAMQFEVDQNWIIAPIYREDILTIYDVVEELVKKLDINKIESKPINDSNIDFEFNWFEINKNKIESYLINKGFSLIKTLNLTSKVNNETFNLFNVKKTIKLINPISNEREYLKNNLIHSHLEVIANNFAYKNELINTFELSGLNYDNKWTHHLAITFVSDLFNNPINHSFLKLDLLLIKSLLTDLFNNFNLTYEIKPISQNNSLILLVNNGFEIWLNNKLIGYASQINPDVLTNFKIKTESKIYFIELIVDHLLNNQNINNIFVGNKSKEHAIIRNITLVANKENGYNKIKDIFADFVKQQLINNYKIFNTYTKEDMINYTFEFTINPVGLEKKATKDINNILELLINAFEKAQITVKK